MRRPSHRRRRHPCASEAEATAIKRFCSRDSYSIDPAQVEGETRPNRKILVESMGFRYGLVTHAHCLWGLWLMGDEFTYILNGADGKLLTVPRDAVAIDRGVWIGGSVFRRLKRWMLALSPEHKIKICTGGAA